MSKKKYAVVILVASIFVSLAEEGIARGQKQRLRALFNRRRVGGDTRGYPKISQSTSETRKQGKETEDEETNSQSNEDYLLKLLKDIDLDDQRLFGKTTTTKRPYRFRPATKRERIREKVTSAVSTEIVKEVPSNKIKKKPIQRKNILRVKIIRKVENNSYENAKSSHFKTRRRKIGVKQRGNAEESKGTKNEEFKTNEGTETKNYKNDTKIEQNTKNPSDNLTYPAVTLEKEDNEEKTAKIHPVFNSFSIVKNVKHTYYAKQRKYSDLLEKLENNVEHIEALGLSQSHEDHMEMLSEMQAKHNFDLAAVKSEINSRKLNQEFFTAQTETALNKLEEPHNPSDGREPEGVEESKRIQSEGKDMQRRKYEPERLVVLSPATGPTVSKPRRQLSPRTRTTPRLDQGPASYIQPRVSSKPTANTEGTISLLSWEQLSY